MVMSSSTVKRTVRLCAKTRRGGRAAIVQSTWKSEWQKNSPNSQRNPQKLSRQREAVNEDNPMAEKVIQAQDKGIFMFSKT